MHKHTITIVFASNEALSYTENIDALMQTLGDQVLTAGGYGVEVDHASQWLDDETAVAYIDTAEPRRSGEPDYSRNHVD
jgi:hypothetical protein